MSFIPDLESKCYDCTGIPGTRRRMICEGTASGISPLERARYLLKWEAEGLVHEVECDFADKLPMINLSVGTPSSIRSISIASTIGHNERVGSFLKARIDGMLAIKTTEGCGCATLAAQMDVWGIEGCEKRREEIVARLVSNRNILIASLKENGSWSTSLAVFAGFVPDSVLRKGANWLLTKAIEDARAASLVPPAPRQAISSRSQVMKSTIGLGSVFRYNPEGARFISSKQLQEDTLKLLSKIPNDITAIAGVARSGLSVATMLSMYLHIPMITVRQSMNDIIDTGNGWRLGGSDGHVDPKKGRVLVVDDTVMTGNSIRAIRPLVQRTCGDHLFATVYCNPTSLVKPDIFAVELKWPHILEWNVFNSVLSPSVAMDFDGILCRDCPVGDDDDGHRYLEFIRTAKPLYMPRRSVVPLIVTARIEKYRGETESWLKSHGIRWEKLVMHPANTLAERMRDDIPAYKAKHFVSWAKKAQGRMLPLIFMESEDRQAARIGSLAKGHGRLVVCPSSGGVYG